MLEIHPRVHTLPLFLSIRRERTQKEAKKLPIESHTHTHTELGWRRKKTELTMGLSLCRKKIFFFFSSRDNSENERASSQPKAQPRWYYYYYDDDDDFFLCVLFIPLWRGNTQIFYWLLYCPSAEGAIVLTQIQTSKMAPASFLSNFFFFFCFPFSSGSNWIELLLHNNQEKSSSSSFLREKEKRIQSTFCLGGEWLSLGAG